MLDTFSKTFRIITYFDSRNQPINRQDFLLRIIWPNHTCVLGSIEVLTSGGSSRFLSDYTLESACIDFQKINTYNVNIIFCDLTNQIISSTFELEIENECGDVYEITDGRFDARFRYF